MTQLFNRYKITKIEGETDPNAEYFVLRLDDGGKDRRHVAACKKALLTYAEEIEYHLPELSKEIIDKYYVKEELIGESVSEDMPRLTKKEILDLLFSMPELEFYTMAKMILHCFENKTGLFDNFNNELLNDGKIDAFENIGTLFRLYKSSLSDKELFINKLRNGYPVLDINNLNEVILRKTCAESNIII